MMEPNGKQIIAVTGATGFVGGALANELQTRGYGVRKIVRAVGKPSTNTIEIGEIDGNTEWSNALSNVTTVIHCAARVHVLKEFATDPLASFRAVNVVGTSRLASKAAELGVKRFIYISSVKVNGESTDGLNEGRGGLFTPFDQPNPSDPYGISKWEAEKELWRISQESGMEVVIVRPPLVYGAGVKANFLRLIKLVKLGLPLPLGCINNKRSMIALVNLIDFLILCTAHPLASGQTFMISDGLDLSTVDLVRKISSIIVEIERGKGSSVRYKYRKTLIVPVPIWTLNFVSMLVNREEEINRLIGSLQVDISHSLKSLSWAPPISVDEGLRGAVSYVID